MTQLSALALLMCGLCLACNGPDRDLEAPYRTLSVPVARLTSPSARQRGAVLFAAHCAICHGPRGDGRGQRQSGFARPAVDFTRPTWRATTSPRRVFSTLREGVRGSAMPAWPSLSNDEIWDLTAYLFSLSAPAPAATPRDPTP